MKPNLGLSVKKLESITIMLSITLSNEVILYTKIRKFHWNVSGESFMEYHKLFESHYKEIEEKIDEIAEKISKMGAKAIGTTKEFVKLSIIKEEAGIYPTSKDMLKELVTDHEKIIIQLRAFIKETTDKAEDPSTADFLTGLLQTHETISWTLRRYFA